MNEILHWLMLLALALLLLSVIVAPIMAAVFVQNIQRRRHMRALATTFGLNVDLDPTRRFSRATPSVRGQLEGCKVLIETAVSSDIFHTQGHSRADLGRVSVSAPRRSDDVILRISPPKTSDTGGAPTVTLALSSGEDTHHTPWLTEDVRAHLADHQRRYEKHFAVAWLATGMLSSHTSALFTKRSARLTEDRVRLLVRLSHAVVAAGNEGTT